MTIPSVIAQHHGRIVKIAGDGMLVEFASVIDAVTCAMSRADQLVGQIGIADYKQTSSAPKKRFQLSEVESLKTSLARHQSAASCLQ